MISARAIVFGIPVVLVCNNSFAAPPITAPESMAPAPAIETESTANMGVEERLTRIEQMLSNKVMFDLLQQLEQLRLEISELRESAEQQEHQMSVLTKRQRSLYQDIDRRLLDLESGSVRSGSTLSRTTPPVPVSNPAMTTAPAVAAMPASNTTSPALTVSGNPADEKSAYSKAFNLLKEGRYSQAIIAFREFLTSYGDGKYADNAQYWLGEANYVSREYKIALKEFKKIISDFPDSPKKADAELKIGFTYYELKDWQAARKSLSQVIEHYPNTTVARLAEQRLNRLSNEGR